MYTHSQTFAKATVLCDLMLELCQHFPKYQRFTVGKKLEDLSLELVMSLAAIETLPDPLKMRELSIVVGKTNGFLTIAYFCFKKKLFNETNYIKASELAREIAKMAQGWINSLR